MDKQNGPPCHAKRKDSNSLPQVGSSLVLAFHSSDKYDITDEGGHHLI